MPKSLPPGCSHRPTNQEALVDDCQQDAPQEPINRVDSDIAVSGADMARSGVFDVDTPLYRHRGLHGHVATQFFGAFNDNLFKQLILFLAARELFAGKDQQGVAFALFSLPFVLFSGIAGDLSERFSKRTIIVLMKVAEIGIMLAGIWALQQRSWYGLLFVLFLMGSQSAFFGPSKYGIVPELVGRKNLLAANGVISMTTFLSIVLGQALAGPLLDRYPQQLWIAGVWCVAIAVVGTLTSLLIPKLVAQRPQMRVRKSPFGSVFSSLRELRTNRAVLHLLAVNALFWFNGGVVQQAITGLGAPQYLDVSQGQTWRLSLLLVALATAIIVGSLCVAPLARIIEPGKLVLVGAVGMFSLELALAVVTNVWGSDGYTASIVVLLLLGFCGALFAVPVQTFLQHAPVPGTRGKTFAVNNFLNFSCIFLAGGYYIVTSRLALHPALACAIAAASMMALAIVFRTSVLQIKRAATDTASAS